MPKVLVVAYYFPPMGLSGVQRVAKLVKFLPEYGWQPTVLTVEPAGYFAYDETLLREVQAAGVEIVRTTSWDPTRLFGRKKTVALPAESQRRWLSLLSQCCFVPDNKIGWMPHAVRKGRELLRNHRFEAVLSSAPPYTAHLIGARLSRLSGLPLFLDFRDDWVGNPRHIYPTPVHRWLHERLERRVVRGAARVMAINEPIRDAIRARNGDRVPVTVLPQGFDPADFEAAPAFRSSGKLRFLYTGVFYDAQTPDYFLKALAAWLGDRPEAREKVEAVFAGLLPADSMRLIEALGLSDVVHYEGYLSHEAVVAHQLAADVLWLTVGRRAGAEGISTSKLYEYMGARKPILALVPEGAARRALTPYGAAYCVEPDDVQGIAHVISELFLRWESGRLPVPDGTYVRQFDRRRLAGVVAEWLSSSAAAH